MKIIKWTPRIITHMKWRTWFRRSIINLSDRRSSSLLSPIPLTFWTNPHHLYDPTNQPFHGRSSRLIHHHLHHPQWWKDLYRHLPLYQLVSMWRIIQPIAQCVPNFTKNRTPFSYLSLLYWSFSSSSSWKRISNDHISKSMKRISSPTKLFPKSKRIWKSKNFFKSMKINFSNK